MAQTTTPSEAPVEVTGLRKSYGATAAVDGIDLSLRPGEVFSLLGPNGAGKSTAVEILSGFRTRDAGRARVLGVDPGTAGRAWRARLGIVWQTQVEGSPLPARDVLRHFAGYYPDPRDPDEVLELVGLTEKARAGVRTLSGGMRRRLDVALGIIGRPELLFLDEPTTGFDPAARRRFWELIRHLATEGTTILLTTHYLDEAEALADRVAVIAQGRIVAHGDPATLGGRADARATVSWLEDGARREVRTDRPTRLVAELTARLADTDPHRGAGPGQIPEIPELSVHRPTLEDIYLEMVGHDAAGAEDIVTDASDTSGESALPEQAAV